MKTKRRLLGLTAALAVVLAGGGRASGQEGATPLPSLPEPMTQPQTSMPVAPPQADAPAAPVLPPPGAPAAVLPPPGALPARGGPTAPPVPNATPAPKADAPQEPSRSAVSFQDVPLDPNAGPTQGNPTGRQEPGLSLEWVCPSNARLGQPVTCQIIVKSISTNRVHGVVLRARIPEGVTVKATEPKGNPAGDAYVWELGTFEPRQEKRLDLLMLPTTRANLALHAFVTFTGSSTARLQVREPKLTLHASAPGRVVADDPATITLTVSNPGDGTAEYVRVKANLTDGLEHGKGKALEFNLESLAPGESRTVLLMCGARATGEQTCTAVATADLGLSAQGAATIDVVAPKLEVAVSGPGMRYLERHAVLTFKVSNPGTATASQVTLTDHVPPGFKVASTTGGGRHDFVSRSVVWFLGDVGPGQTKEVNLELIAINPGEHRNRAVVTATRGLKAEGEVVTRVEGLPALLMELVDVDDPVEVGKDTSYEIRVTNTGTKTETNLQVICTLPEQMEFRGARGAAGCPFKIEGREVSFEPIPRLAPRVDAIYRVNVRCLTSGDARFQARMKADGLALPVLREESTRIYGDEPAMPIRPVSGRKQ
ncbi:MAG: DUF11 domain-containing protein [Gemmataceae bacterium]|nr:DUF11 domain-containing protein [Gemmataceae bacterium]